VQTRVGSNADSQSIRRLVNSQLETGNHSKCC